MMKTGYWAALLLAIVVVLPGCYGGYQDAEIPADYKDTTYPSYLPPRLSTPSPPPAQQQ
jgi:hypothetical protein